MRPAPSSIFQVYNTTPNFKKPTAKKSSDNHLRQSKQAHKNKLLNVINVYSSGSQKQNYITSTNLKKNSGLIQKQTPSKTSTKLIEPHRPVTATTTPSAQYYRKSGQLIARNFDQVMAHHDNRPLTTQQKDKKAS